MVLDTGVVVNTGPVEDMRSEPIRKKLLMLQMLAARTEATITRVTAAATRTTATAKCRSINSNSSSSSNGSSCHN